MFEHTVLRDTACNVAYWNLHERTLERTTDGVYTVDGNPLRFFHYSGHDPHRPVPAVQARRRPGPVAVDRKPALRRLLRERSDRHAGDRPRVRPAAPTAWGARAEGLRLDLTTRPRLLGRGRGPHRAEGREPPPPGFGPDRGRRLREWLVASRQSRQPDLAAPRRRLAGPSRPAGRLPRAGGDRCRTVPDVGPERDRPPADACPAARPARPVARSPRRQPRGLHGR